MLVQNLAITYKCFSSIGNSLNLKEMMNEVLKSFVSETYAIYGEYAIADETKNMVKLSSFGKINDFNPNKYKYFNEKIKLVVEEDKKVLILNLDYGAIYLITKNLEVDCSFFLSMFESFMNKLNISIQACINVQKLEESNRLLKDQQKELQRASKAKDDFMANMSHELKTPLNSINVISSVMKKNKDGLLNDKQIKNLEIINSCGNYLLTLINDVLDISKLEAGRIDVNYSKINLFDTVNEVYEMFMPQVYEKQSNLFFRFDDTIKEIYSDDHKIKQIVKNLLSNALKFVGDGSIYLDVKDEDEYVTIIIKDEGIGIPEDKLQTIFDRFKQADSTTTRKYGGTGLGLAICKELLDLMKGTIYVKSEINAGTTFFVTIPKNLDNLIHMEILDLNDDKELIIHPKISQIKYEEINNKTKILILNTDALEFFKIVISLQKEFNVIQVYKKIDLIKANSSEIKNVLIDIDTMDKDDLNDLISTFGNKLVILTNDVKLKLSQELDVKIIHKNEINLLEKKLKEYNER